MSKFSKLSSKIQKEQGVSKKSADAITATIGRGKYGKQKFQEMAAAGKKKKKWIDSSWLWPFVYCTYGIAHVVCGEE